MKRHPCFSVTTLMVLPLMVAGVVAAAVPSIPAVPSSRQVSIGQINRADLMRNVQVRGVIAAYVAPTSPKAPHSLIVRDATGTIRLAVWNDVWKAVPVRASLVPGAQVVVEAEVAEFRGSLELHLSSPHALSVFTIPGAFPGAGGTTAASGVAGIPWTSSVDDAFAVARQTRRKVLLFFDSPYGKMARVLGDRVFSDQRVIAALSREFVPVRIDITKDQGLATSLGVFRSGTVCLFAADGSQIKQMLDINTSDELLKEIQQ